MNWEESEMELELLGRGKYMTDWEVTRLIKHTSRVTSKCNISRELGYQVQSIW